MPIPEDSEGTEQVLRLTSITAQGDLDIFMPRNNV